MDLDRYQRAAKLFEEAMALSPDDRHAHVERAAKGDEELARRVRRMVRYAERPVPTEGFLPNGVREEGGAHSAASLTGAQIGRYRIVRVVGEGGFGTVYQAAQERPVRRTVALKILKSGMDSQRVIARFEAERQALAMLEHPGIARVIDAGTTDPIQGSRPYFVMELVSGEPITEFCDRKLLNYKARLDLFCTVCHAVQHAHQRGIIHRDLKPSNILVGEDDGQALPKIIDFGIAKAISGGQPLTDAMLVTNRMELLGTPQYMSPEQADSDEKAIDTRTDVYSLGVALYELLTGTTPLDAETLSSTTYSQMLKMILEQKVERPSTRLARLGEAALETARLHNSDLKSLRRRLRGELDWITMKALDADRERRYGSAAALAEDIGRYLNHQPVLAGPPGAVYRVRKFVRRHRLGVSAATIVALAIIGGAIIATIGMVQARRSADQALQVNQFMRDVLTSANPDNRGADVRLVDVLDAASSTTSERFAGHPEMEAQVRYLLGTVYNRLTMMKHSENEFRQAAALWQTSAGSDDQRTLDAMLSVGLSLVNQDRGREAEQYLGDILPRLDRAFGPNHEKSLEGRCVVGDMHRSRGRLEESERLLRETLARAQAAGASEIIHLRLLNALTGTLWQKISNVDPAQRGAAIDDCIASARELLARSSREPTDHLWYTLTAQQNLANLSFMKGDNAQAVAQARQLLEDSRDRLGECHNIRIAAMNTLAGALNRLGIIGEPADLYLRTTACTRAASGDNSIRLLSNLSAALPYLERSRRWSEAEACVREFMQILQAMGGGHVGTFYYEICRAHFVSHQGRFDEAQQMFESLQARKSETENIFQSARLESLYASHLVRQGHFEQAEQHLNAAVAMLSDIRDGTLEQFPDDVLVELIALYTAWGKPDEVRKYESLRAESLERAALRK